MRVLLVVHTFPPHSLGGCETYAESQASAFARRGHHVTVITREAEGSAPEYRVRQEARDGLTIHWINNTFRSIGSFAETYANAAVDAVVASLVDETRPDVAHVHHLTGLSTGIVSLLEAREIPVVFTAHDYWLLCHRGQLLDRHYRVCSGPDEHGCRACLDSAAAANAVVFGLARVTKMAAATLPNDAGQWLQRTAGRTWATVAARRGADTAGEAGARLTHMRAVASLFADVLVPSEDIGQRLESSALRLRRPRHWLLGQARDAVQPKSNGSPPRGGRPLRLGFIGALTVSKAPHLIADAMARLPPGTATVDVFGAYSAYHGDDSYRETVTRISAAPGVTVHGPIRHADVPGALARLDVLVVPSIWPENSPLVIREAFLAGVPVLASRIGGIPEAVAHGVNGLLFEAGDLDGLMSAIKMLVDTPDLLNALQQGARASPVRSLDDDLLATEGLYQEALQARDQAPNRRRLAAVVLHFGNPEETRLCVRSLLASHRPVDDLIVVDNDPARRCFAAIADVRNQVVYLESPSNRGFAAGVNRGIREAMGRAADYVLIVNNDVIVPPDAIRRLEHGLESSRGAGAAGPVVLQRSDPGRVSTMGMSFDSRTGRMRHPEFGQSIENVRNIGRPSVTVDAISGCAMLLGRAALEAVGLFDEAYFFSFEDVDWCLRARRAGLSTVAVPAARVYHEGSASVGSESPERLYHAARSHVTLVQNAKASFWTLGTVAALNLAHACRAQGATLPQRLRAVVRGLRDARHSSPPA